jgi:hypothetical protein
VISRLVAVFYEPQLLHILTTRRARADQLQRWTSGAFRRGGKKWASGNQFLPSWVYREIQTFKTSGSQKQQIAFFGEHYLVNGKELVQTNDRKPDTACDVLTLGHREQYVLFLSLDAKLFESRRWNPSEFAPRVHQHLGNDRRFSAINGILNLASCVNRAHANLLAKKYTNRLGII